MTQLRRYRVVLRKNPEVVSKPTKTSKNAAKCHFLSAMRDLVVYAPKTNDHYTSFQESLVSGCQKTSLLKNLHALRFANTTPLPASGSAAVCCPPAPVDIIENWFIKFVLVLAFFMTGEADSLKSSWCGWPYDSSFAYEDDNGIERAALHRCDKRLLAHLRLLRTTL